MKPVNRFPVMFGKNICRSLGYVSKKLIVNKDLDPTMDYSTFQITWNGKGEQITATYKADGKLVNTNAYAKNVKLPDAVTKSIMKQYPGWTLTKDVHKISMKGNGKMKNRYRVIINMGNDTMRVITDKTGKILNKPKISK